MKQQLRTRHETRERRENPESLRRLNYQLSEAGVGRKSEAAHNLSRFFLKGPCRSTRQKERVSKEQKAGNGIGEARTPQILTKQAALL